MSADLDPFATPDKLIRDRDREISRLRSDLSLAYQAIRAKSLGQVHELRLRDLRVVTEERDQAREELAARESELRRYRSTLSYYADFDGNTDEEGRYTYESLAPPEGWVGEEYDPSTQHDEGKLAQGALDREDGPVVIPDPEDAPHVIPDPEG